MDSKKKSIKVFKRLIDPSEFAFQDSLEAQVNTFGFDVILRPDGRIKERPIFIERVARRFQLDANTIDRNVMYYIHSRGCKSLYHKYT